MRISVAMATRNGARFLERQLASLAAQTRPPDELVISDDASTDATTAIVQTFAARAPFPVRFSQNPAPLGVVGNFERAIEITDGDVIALCDQDDLWVPDKLKMLEMLFIEDIARTFIFTDANLIDENDALIRSRLWSATMTDAQRERIETDPWGVLLGRNVVTGATVAFRATLKAAALPIPKKIDLLHDGWLALVAAGIGRVHACPEALVSYRIHPGQHTGLGKAEPPPPQSGRADAFAHSINRLKSLKIRLLEKGMSPADPKIVEIEAFLTHQTARGGLPASRLARIPAVLRELAAGRYRRFANGWLSAGKDLFQ
jgi:hypothetical protein